MPDTVVQLTDEEYETILMDDELYFESCLMIRTKEDGLQPLRLNSSQRYVHDRIEEIRQRTGRVRVLIPKGAATRCFDVHGRTLLQEGLDNRGRSGVHCNA